MTERKPNLKNGKQLIQGSRDEVRKIDGTRFLVQIGDTSPLLQLKLLRVLQEGDIRRVEDDRSTHVNVRLITATNQDMIKRMASGDIREDFYYRIKVLEITLPLLRERREDIPLFVNHVMSQGTSRGKSGVKGMAQDALQCLMQYAWPSNVREFRNAMEHAFVTVKGEYLTLWDFPPEIRKPPFGHL